MPKPRRSLVQPGALLILAAALVLTLSATPRPAQGSGFRSLTATEAATMIQRADSGATVVFLYAAYCPHCRTIFPDFVALADRYRSRGVSVLAFATDEDAADSDEYVGSQRLPFARLHIERSQKGALAKALARVGIEIGDDLGIPMIVVLDDGEVAGRWTGTSGVGRAERWLAEHTDS